jgi:hypothetical protein
MSAALRLLKVSRRQRKEASKLDDWTSLRDVGRKFYQASESVKYESLEMIYFLFLFILDLKVIVQTSLASEIVQALSQYHVILIEGLSSRDKIFWTTFSLRRNIRTNLAYSLFPAGSYITAET